MTAEHPIQVVVAYDFTPSAEWALARAVDAALRAPMHVLHVVAVLDRHDRLPILADEDLSYDTADRVAALLRERVEIVAAGRGTFEFYPHVRIGRPAHEILDVAGSVGAELIFIGSHGETGVERWLLGSVSERIVREARCPVMVVREATYAHVELAPVVEYEHERHIHRGPHTYTLSNDRVITRPRDWPLV